MNIQTTKDLEKFCKKLQACDYIAIDTEFLRERTYYPVLCLIQIATPKMAACVDVMSDIDLKSLFDVLQNPNVLKVFHSCRQDVEIFYHLMGKVPTPLFDTQVGAMVCGLGENVSYHDLVEAFLHEDIDKASRVTDWSKRPLTDEQITYALNDVTYLVSLYPKMHDLLLSTKRIDWVAEEMSALSDPKLYYTEPQEAWLRVKPLSTRPKYLAVLQSLCAWREQKAQELNKPRRYILRDEVILQLASVMPEKEEDFNRLRYGETIKKGWYGEIISAVQSALGKTVFPAWHHPKSVAVNQQGVYNILKLLLDVVSADEKVASKLIASADDLKQLISDSNADIPVLKGWRRDIFGQKALDFKDGRLGMFFNPKTQKVEWVDLKKKL